MKKIHFILLTILCFASCAKKREEMKEASAAMETGTTQAVQNNNRTESSVSKDHSKNIKIASIRFQVEHLDKSTEQIEALMKLHQSFIESSEMNNNQYIVENRIKIRVPNEHFESLIKALGKESVYMDFKNINAENVSAEFVDIEARLKTKREVEQRYMEILRKQAKTIKDVLNAEDQIRVLHEDIEAKVSRLNYLKDQVSYSTIDLQFYQKVNFVPEPEKFEKKFSYKFSEAFSNGWEILINIFLGIIYVWPLLIIIFSGIIAIRIYWKKKSSPEIR